MTWLTVVRDVTAAAISRCHLLVVISVFWFSPSLLHYCCISQLIATLSVYHATNVLHSRKSVSVSVYYWR